MFVISTIIFLSVGTEFSGWYAHSYTNGAGVIRYGGFMYEASHFCLVITPVLLFLVAHYSKIKNCNYYIAALAIPLAFTYSAGFVVTILAALLLVYAKKIKHRKILIRALTALLAGSISILILYSAVDPVQKRIDNILSWQDTSVKGRTIESYQLAFNIAKLKSAVFGVGYGQTKVIGRGVVTDYYGYAEGDLDAARIPSSAAETLVSIGMLGFTLKILALIYIYLKFQVGSSDFGKLLYLFFFIYQFYGSFMLSTMEFYSFALAVFYSISSRRSPQ